MFGCVRERLRFSEVAALVDIVEVNNVVEGGICKQACLSDDFSEQNSPALTTASSACKVVDLALQFAESSRGSLVSTGRFARLSPELTTHSNDTEWKVGSPRTYLMPSSVVLVVCSMKIIHPTFRCYLTH